METRARRSPRAGAGRRLAVPLAALAAAAALAAHPARAQCDNGVAIYGTACKTQGDSVEYVCQPGSTPGHSLWNPVACVGGTCQGASCPAGCDNGVAIYGTACRTQGDSVQYVCQPGSTPGNSSWQAQSCNGGTCQGAACTAPPPPGCDNGVAIYGTACRSQGDSVEYVCQPGSTPGHSVWQAQSCNGGTCQGAACTAPPPAAGCDNGVAVGGTACQAQGDSVEYVCQPGSTPGHSIWQAQSCNGGSCQGAACTSAPPTAGCDNGVPVGGTACANPGDPVAYVCQAGSSPGNSLWQSVSCNGGICVGSACTAAASVPAGCDNGVPVGGTACARQDDAVQYVCLAGSTPGASRWQAQTCAAGAVCRGSSCTSAVSTTSGCDNGVAVGGTACANDGDSVQYVCQPGSTPGHSLWVAQSCAGGACHVYRCSWQIEWDLIPIGGGFGLDGGGAGGVVIPVRVGRGTMQVDANYTDVGTGATGSLDADLDRLHRVGVRNVRIWADDGTGPDEGVMAQRIAAVASAARARGMGVTVDLFDAHRNSGNDPETMNIPGVNDLLRRRFQTVVAPNRSYTNVTWSIGNEIVGPSTPLAFARWYRDRVRELRAAAPGRLVVAELVPGSANHFVNAECWQAAKLIVAASDRVSVHYYYKESGSPDGDMDYQSLLKWRTLAGWRFQVGEVGVINDSGALSQDERYRRLTDLLARFQDLNVSEAKIWQFLKDEPSHFDPEGFDLNGKPDVSSRLVADHWLFPPR